MMEGIFNNTELVVNTTVHFTVVCSVTMNASEVGVDFNLTDTALSAFSFKCQLVSIRAT